MHSFEDDFILKKKNVLQLYSLNGVASSKAKFLGAVLIHCRYPDSGVNECVIVGVSSSQARPSGKPYRGGITTAQMSPSFVWSF